MMFIEGESARRSGQVSRRRALGRAGRVLAALAAVATMPLFAASAAQAAEPPVITGVSPDHGQIGYEHGEQNPSITITGQNLAGATVTAPDFWSDSGEQEFQVVEDSETSLVVKSLFANVPGVRELTVHTPGGTATTSITYTPRRSDPLIGRCPHGGPEGGEFWDSKCESKIVAEGNPVFPGGKYDWREGLASPAVSFAGGAFRLAEVPQVTCTSVDGSGSLFDAHEVNNVILTFHGCEHMGTACSNTATAGDVKTAPLLLSFGWWRKNLGATRKKPAVGLFSQQIEGTIAQFDCGSEAIALGGGWEAPVKAGKDSSSLPFTFGQNLEGKEKRGLINQEWLGWGAYDVPEMTVDGKTEGMARPAGTLSMSAPEPFLLSTRR